MIQKPPGIEDIFPHDMPLRNHVINTAKDVFRLFNVREIVIPIMEYTEVFSRGLGDETDIVSKEMFTFEDRGGRSLTLRPEGTASVVRAYVENGEYNRLSQAKFFYTGPMFRAERPQKGRLRQFTQFGAELFGGNAPWADYEAIAMMNEITRRLGITEYTLAVNSIGCQSCRPGYLAALSHYYAGKNEVLCGDCRRRASKNILRLLDCKVPGCREIRTGAPVITDYLCNSCRTHHGQVLTYLNSDGITFTEDPFLVRGLDYYTGTTFEFLTSAIGSQNAFAAGGRYDGLVEQFGGKPKPAVGFAAGIERLVLMLGNRDVKNSGIDAWILLQGSVSTTEGLALISLLRKNGFSADMDPEGGNFKNQAKKAEREQARCLMIIGDDELASGSVTIRKTGDPGHVTVSRNSIPGALQAILAPE